MALPEGVTPEAFAKAIAAFQDAIGAENVYINEDDVALYRDAYSPAWGEDYELTASAAVAPASTEEVAKIVKIANEFLIPLFAISTGKNLGYGGSAPNMIGSVICDLKRMKQVIEVDDVRNFCVVEPGVSYFDMYDYITANNKKVIVDCPDPGWGSLIGNALERGVGYMLPMYRDHWNAHCGLEAVLPNGEILRTGMFAVEGSETYGENKYGFGPMVDGLFSQGNFGIVTKMAFWMMPMPEHHISGLVKVYKYEDLTALIEECNYLEDMGIGGHIRWGTPLALPANNIDPELAAIHQQPGNGTVEQFQAYADKKGVEFFNVTLNFWGSRETCMAQWDYAQKRLSRIPGVAFEIHNDVDYPMTEEKLKTVRHHVSVGVPEMSIFSLGIRSDLLPTPSDGHMWFSPVIPRNAEGLMKAQKVFAQAFKDMGMPSPIGPFTTPRTWIYRSFVMVLAMGISRTDPEKNKQNIAAFRKLVEIGAEHGWVEYRTAPLFHDQVSKTFNFNDGILKKVQNTLKDAMDPNGIIAPGRGGVWPARLREGK